MAQFRADPPAIHAAGQELVVAGGRLESVVGAVHSAAAVAVGALGTSGHDLASALWRFANTWAEEARLAGADSSQLGSVVVEFAQVVEQADTDGAAGIGGEQ